MADDVLAPFINDLPPAKVPVEGVWSRLLQGTGQQAVFFRLPKGLTIPPHSHAAQWGVVISGRLDLTVSGQKLPRGPGETYYIPAGAVHEVHCHTDVVALDVFNDPKRYETL